MHSRNRRNPQEQQRRDRSQVIRSTSSERRTTWARVRLVVGALVLVMLVWRVGTGPFVEGIRLTSAWSILVATGITAITTLCCAWRWRVVADQLGVRLGLGHAVAAVYQAQFLNASLPGGVLGDVDRAVGHGRSSGSLGTSVRSVVWERALGQAVQVVLTIGILLVLPSTVRGPGLALALGVLALGGLVLTGIALAGRRPVLRVRAHRLASDLRLILASPARTGIAAVSALAVAGHLTVFVVAADVAGAHASVSQLLPLAAIVLLAAAIPANVAGWGPREGVAAWAFGAAGLGIATGVTTAVVYGVVALVATLPGALVLLAGRRPARPATAVVPVLEGAARA
jgi:glycosyltransferase 2 family protein